MKKSEKKKSPGLVVAVVGATGLVGKELLELLGKRRFPVAELMPFAGHGRQKIPFGGKLLEVKAPHPSELKKANLVFFVSNEDVARKFAPRLAKSGTWVIDDSSAFRLHPQVPLVIPEVNADVLTPHQRLVAGPNCTLTGIAVAGFPIYKKFGVRSLRIATYQAVSGAGREALKEFQSQVKAWTKSRRLKPRFLPRPIAFNVFPQVGYFDKEGHSGEEVKVSRELKKIWNAPNLKVSVTAVRVPVFRGHSLAVWMETGKSPGLVKLKETIQTAPGVCCMDGLANKPSYPTPLETASTHPVYVGRIRPSETSPREFMLWIVSDNLLKGAALNSVQIAEHLLRKGYLKPRSTQREPSWR